MRIGIDCRIYGTGFTGIGRYTYELVKHYIEENDKLETPHEIVLFFNSPEYEKFSPAPHTQKVLVNARHYSFSEQTNFLKKLYKEKCDVVHFPHFNVPVLYKKPFVVTVHDLTLSIFPGQKMTKWHHRAAYNLTIKSATKKAKKIIAISENTKKDIIEYLKISPDKIIVIPNGVDSQFREIKDESKINATLEKYSIKKEFLLYTGVWRSHKNLPRLIEAFSILKKEKNADIELVITGKPDPHYPEVKETVSKFNLQDDVVFPGMVEEEELIHLYNAAKIFTLPSLYEGFGLPVLEAMRCGTPVAASTSSSIPEVCGEENAILFDPKNTRDIAEKMFLIYKDPELQAKLKEKGLSHAQKYSWEKTAHATFKEITNV